MLSTPFTMAAFRTRRRITIGTAAGDSPSRNLLDQRRTPAVHRSPRNATVDRSTVVIATKRTSA
jgi:hypothetical protein